MTEISKNEARLLTALNKKKEETDLKALTEQMRMGNSASVRSALRLSEKELIDIEKGVENVYRLTEEGLLYATQGLPEYRVVEKAREKGRVLPLGQILKKLKINPKLTPIILGWIKRKNLATITKNQDQLFIEKVVTSFKRSDEDLLKKIRVQREIAESQLTVQEKTLANILKKRNLISDEQQTRWMLKLTDKGRQQVEKGLRVESSISQLTAEDIATGKWRKIKLRRYNIKAPVQIIWPGKLQPYNKFLDELKEKLVALGFQEMVGPTVEYMFFNCDALFMPQDHPAREIHDMYFVQKPRYGNLTQYSNFVMNVKGTHENGWRTGSRGWRYRFDNRESERLILRSHGTAISARMLINKNLKIPGKYFSVARCYRPEVTDRMHLSEFNQVEGIIVAEDLTLRDLLGVLERFALEIAEADKVRFKPDYFPFTEPSIELQAYKKGYGWLEFGGSGIFRPELTLPLGIEVPVLAWGLGVDRLFMMKTGIQDIRDLFTQDLQWMRTQKAL
ncbi:phenylalanine--tRNA ligase subunit alpha [[Eubacterium] cellulosolvens]